MKNLKLEVLEILKRLEVEDIITETLNNGSTKTTKLSDEWLIVLIYNNKGKKVEHNGYKKSGEMIFESRFEVFGDYPKMVFNKNKEEEWTKEFIFLHGEVYQTSYENTNGDFSKSEYRIIDDEVERTYNEDNEGFWGVKQCA